MAASSNLFLIFFVDKFDKNPRYDRVSDVAENGGRLASKILTHKRMHLHWSTIANLKANMPRIQNMYNMYRAKVDRLAGKTDFLLKRA